MMLLGVVKQIIRWAGPLFTSAGYPVIAVAVLLERSIFLGLIIPGLISGSVIVETMFQWDGAGRLYFDAIYARDYPTVLGLTVATAVVTLLASLAADILYAVADPRIRVGAKVR